MGEAIPFDKKERKRLPITIDGKKYVSAQDFGERIGATINTVYQMKSEGRTEGFCINYLGRLYFEEKAIDPFMRSQVRKLK